LGLPARRFCGFPFRPQAKLRLLNFEVMDADNIVPFEAPTPPRSSAIPMKNDLVEQAAEIVADPLVLINLVSKRVAQLNQGRSPLIEALPSMGFADIALTEIIEGKIKLVEGSNS
jgi:DNA-directed RNA polymerase subunit omega